MKSRVHKSSDCEVHFLILGSLYNFGLFYKIGQDGFQMRFKSGLQIPSQMGWKCLCGALETPEELFLHLYC